MNCEIGSRAGTPQAIEYLAKFRRGSSSLARQMGNSAKYMTVKNFLDFMCKTALEDPLAIRAVLTRAGLTLSFEKFNKYANDGLGIEDNGLLTQAAIRVREEEELKKVSERSDRAFWKTRMNTRHYLPNRTFFARRSWRRLSKRRIQTRWPVLRKRLVRARWHLRFLRRSKPWRR